MQRKQNRYVAFVRGDRTETGCLQLQSKPARKGGRNERGRNPHHTAALDTSSMRPNRAVGGKGTTLRFNATWSGEKEVG